jgi:hypothetical protein
VRILPGYERGATVQRQGDKMTEGRRKAGRKPAEIDLTELEKLSSLHCTDQEIADWFGVSTRTVENRRKHPEFAQAMQRGRSKGRISVRRAQMKMLESGNSTMGVWLGKQLLGQRDAITNEHVGSGGGPVQMAIKLDLTRFSDEELQQLRSLAVKAVPDRRG